MHKSTLVGLAFFLLFLSACNRNDTVFSEETTITGTVASTAETKAQAQIERVADKPTPMPPPLRDGAHTDIPDLSGGKIIVPDNVKGKWKSVVFMLEDKKSHAITDHSVNIGDEWQVPGSKITVKTSTFLPDLLIQGTVFTSVSNELKNPAVHVTISENGTELFTGWLFSLFPTMHAFEHEQFAITLKDVTPS